RLYMYTLDKKIVALDTALSANAKALEGDHINRIADFDIRTSLFHADPKELVDPSPLLGEIESAMVPGVVLTGYKYGMDAQSANIDGQADNLRKLAEQIMSFKTVKTFSQVKVGTVTNTSEGKIIFSLIAYFR
ncbi:MAG: hypothetical protein Q8O53_00890, partial [Candidatus Moranbacteria bacterium]|nr:hypothetical protein [Candidatus Moranbacteria bacterium]